MKESLLDYLKHQSPPLSVSRPEKNKETATKDNTKNSQYIAPRYIKRWEDFNLANLVEMYSQVLGHEQERPSCPAIDPIFRDVWNEDAVGSFICDWNSRVVCHALGETQEQLGQTERMWMVRGCFAQKVESPSRPYGPDWAGICTLEEEPQKNIEDRGQKKSLLPGDTKISTKWNFCDGLEDGTIKEGKTEFPTDRRPSWFLPVVQIFTYCYRLKARYGYLITDKELLAVRVGPSPEAPRQNGPVSRYLPENQTRNHGLLEFASFRWVHDKKKDLGAATSTSSGEEDIFPVNLALWWLHLLAAKDNTLQFEYGPLVKECLADLSDFQQEQEPVVASQELEPVVASQEPEPVVESRSFLSQQTVSDGDDSEAGLTSVSGQEDVPTHSFHLYGSFHSQGSMAGGGIGQVNKRSRGKGKRAIGGAGKRSPAKRMKN